MGIKFLIAVFVVFTPILIACIDLSKIPHDLRRTMIEFQTFAQQQNSRKISREFNEIFADMHQEMIHDMELLEMLILNPNERNLIRIGKIYDKMKLNELYLNKLPQIIQNSSKMLNTTSSPLSSTILSLDFCRLMDTLHIVPITMNEIHSDNFSRLDIETKLLIVSSRTIIHSNGFPFQVVLYHYPLSIILIPQLPWINLSYDRYAVLDVFKWIYQYTFHLVFNETVQSMQYLSSNKNNIQHLNHLIDTFHFIPWNTKTIPSNRKWPFHLYLECFERIMSVLHNSAVFNGNRNFSSDPDTMDAMFLLHALQSYDYDLSVYTTQRVASGFPFIFHCVTAVYQHKLYAILEQIIKQLHARNGMQFVRDILYFDETDDKGYYSMLVDILVKMNIEAAYSDDFTLEHYGKSKSYFTNHISSNLMNESKLHYLLNNLN